MPGVVIFPFEDFSISERFTFILKCHVLNFCLNLWMYILNINVHSHSNCIK